MLIDVDSFNPLISDHYLGQGILFSVLWDKGEYGPIRLSYSPLSFRDREAPPFCDLVIRFFFEFDLFHYFHDPILARLSSGQYIDVLRWDLSLTDISPPPVDIERCESYRCPSVFYSLSWVPLVSFVKLKDNIRSNISDEFCAAAPERLPGVL